MQTRATDFSNWLRAGSQSLLRWLRTVLRWWSEVLPRAQAAPPTPLQSALIPVQSSRRDLVLHQPRQYPVVPWRPR